mmetsp:Transcript_64243/g.139781  ORF Transcript_64243/g.139781 Transcript_64243/m.139781 type:complete len:248 (+) Transcript_64243:545-1288(+)
MSQSVPKGPGHVQARVHAFLRENAVVVVAVEDYTAGRLGLLDAFPLQWQVRLVVLGELSDGWLVEGVGGLHARAHNCARVTDMSDPEMIFLEVVVGNGARGPARGGVQALVLPDEFLRGLEALPQRLLHVLLPPRVRHEGGDKSLVGEVRDVVAVGPVAVVDAVNSVVALHHQDREAVLVGRLWLQTLPAGPHHPAIRRPALESLRVCLRYHLSFRRVPQDMDVLLGEGPPPVLVRVRGRRDTDHFA